MKSCIFSSEFGWSLRIITVYALYSYSHDGTNLVVDSITLSLSDGFNSVTKTIDIDLRSDQRPAFVDGLERRLEVRVDFGRLQIKWFYFLLIAK